MSSGKKKVVEKKKNESGNKQQGAMIKLTEDGGVIFAYENNSNIVDIIFQDIAKTTKENLESKKSETKEDKDKKEKKKNVEEFSFTENDNNSFSFKKIEKSENGITFSQFSSYSYSKEL
ncbi:11347_t:CDS:2 [Scutellospora calospora]|uniref:11347_t:CDS:1 n=1 Tax=Scutellospora calospora TaxID=85575 RepID=A0ACA9JXI1_9GLOM|nr:11347_t:CDS:2 [Scutellospora calospora]